MPGLTAKRNCTVNADPATNSSPTDSDEATVARVLAGDTAAFESIVRRWQVPLVNLAWRFCRDRPRAEEMAQEAFLRAWRNLPRFRGDSAFSTWLFALATNLYRTELRRIPATMLSLDQIAEPPDPAIAGSALEESSRDESLRRAVLALPPQIPRRHPPLLFPRAGRPRRRPHPPHPRRHHQSAPLPWPRTAP